MEFIRIQMISEYKCRIKGIHVKPVFDCMLYRSLDGAGYLQRENNNNIINKNKTWVSFHYNPV